MTLASGPGLARRTFWTWQTGIAMMRWATYIASRPVSAR